jgi:Raf kinase inhibitor-like YbhB/YbcL family protein
MMRAARFERVHRRRFLGTATTGVLSAAAGCALGGDGRGQAAADSLTLVSSDVSAGEEIPMRFTCEGVDQSPALSIGDVPVAAGSLALLVDDLDAPGGRFTHWVAWDMPPALREIPRAVPATRRPDVLEGGAQGLNDFDEVGYGGPCPPASDGPHTYRFQVFAHTEQLDLGPDAGGSALLNALETGLVATGGFTASFDR